MSTPRGDKSDFAVFSSGLSAAHRRLVWGRIAHHWPTHAHPEAELLELSDDAGAQHVQPALDATGAALLLLGPESMPHRISRIGDLACNEQRPVLVLAADPDAVARLCAPGEPVILPWNTDPAAVAGALHALRGRQHAVNQLAGDLRLQSQLSASAARELLKLHDEIDLAAMLQREMLPRAMPEFPGYDLSVLYRPTGMLSGDTYDIVRLDEHHIGILLADAAGHGISAALLMMLVSRLLVVKETTHTGYRIVPPGEAMSRLNNAFIDRRGELSALVSAVCAVIDTRTGTVRYASAGHPAPIVVGPSSESLLSDGGPLLGAMPGYEYPEGVARLDSEHLLMLYTDGVEEAFACPIARRAGNEVTQHVDALRRLGQNWLGRGLSRSVEELVEHMDRRHGSLHQADDITLISIGRSAAMEMRAAA
ncbi:MAG: PP2C family protein-serine/threonine phosphatase [Phycisphaerales bacterium]